MTVLKVQPTWEDSKKQLGDASFMERLLKFDKDTLDDQLLRKMTKYTQSPDFTAEVCGPNQRTFLVFVWPASHLVDCSEIHEV